MEEGEALGEGDFTSLAQAPVVTRIEEASEGPMESRATDGGVFKGEAERDACASFLSQELRDTLDGKDRSEFLERLKKWRRQRGARPASETKDYPFPSSANTSPPLTLTRVNTIYARLMANYSVKRPF